MHAGRDAAGHFNELKDAEFSIVSLLHTQLHQPYAQLEGCLMISTVKLIFTQQQ